jgi:hypothetical protein
VALFTIADAIACAIFAALALAILGLAAGIAFRCPRCRRWWALRHLERDVASVDRRRVGSATFTRTTYVRVDECLRCGAVLLRTEVEESPPVSD